MVPLYALHGLEAVRGLQRGRSPARKSEPVRPVSEAAVEATLPFFLPPARAAQAHRTRTMRVFMTYLG
jgi:hypothetical protein